MVVPTGIGASIGGFGGDASLAMNLLSHACDRLITHPNVANAAVFQHLPKNVLYTEGYALDQCFKGDWALRAMANQRIGVVLDAGLPDDIRILTQNAIAAVETVYGVDTVATVSTREPVRLQLTPMPSGTVVGEVDNPNVLVEAAQALINDHGATAIALGVLFPELDLPEETAYRQGQGADPIGGLEALLSHAIVATCQVPCAHAPILTLEEATPETTQLLDPRLAAEFIAPTFLPCVLTGLRQAPSIVPQASQRQPGDITVNEVHAVIAPANALGGIPMLTAIERSIPLIVVESNRTVLDVSLKQLFGGTPLPQSVIPVANYQEAAGVLLALKQSLPMAY